MDPSEPRWRVNSSFSPPLSRRWDRRDQPDGLSQEIPVAPLYGSSLSSYSKGSRSVMSTDQYANHQHSVSDGALSYFESPSNNLQASRWTPPVQRYDLGEFSTPTGGARIDSSASPQSSERQFTARVSSTSHSLFSPSPMAESSRWASSSKPTFLPPRNFPGRHSFMSTPVYPLVFHNPVSDGESSRITGTSSSHRMIPSDHSRNSPPWPETSLNPDLKFHKALSDLQKVEASPNADVNSRREGIRWSNGSSSYDFTFDGDGIDIADHIYIENPRSPNCYLRCQKCGLCCRLLRQKSPWSSHRIVRNNDLPVTSVLPCGHVFHADCLEETTPKSLVQEPPCPLCLNLISHEGSTSLSEPLQLVVRRTPRRIMRVGTTSNQAGRNEIELRRNLSQPLKVSSSIRSHLRKRLSFKVKISRDLFGAKIFRKV